MKHRFLILFSLTIVQFSFGQIYCDNPLTDVKLMNLNGTRGNVEFGSDCMIASSCLLRWVGMIGNDSLVVKLEPDNRRGVWWSVGGDFDKYCCSIGDYVLIKKSWWDSEIQKSKKAILLQIKEKRDREEREAKNMNVKNGIKELLANERK